MSQLGGGKSERALATQIGEEEFWEAETSKEDSDVLLEPASISLVFLAGSATFSVQSIQGTADAENIWAVYSYLVA